jgi:hypothetical protein
MTLSSFHNSLGQADLDHLGLKAKIMYRTLSFVNKKKKKLDIFYYRFYRFFFIILYIRMSCLYIKEVHSKAI